MSQKSTEMAKSCTCIKQDDILDCPRRVICFNINTLCHKLGALQWTCDYDECNCHCKENIKARKLHKCV